jgi:hypothetical protein
LAKEKELQDKIKTHTTPVRDLVNDWTINAVKRFLANEMPNALTEYDRTNKVPKIKPHKENEMPSGPFHPGKEQVSKTQLKKLRKNRAKDNKAKESSPKTSDNAGQENLDQKQRANPEQTKAPKTSKTDERAEGLRKDDTKYQRKR